MNKEAVETTAPSTVSAWNSATALEAEFALLVQEWRRDTQFLSSVQGTVFHPAYQRIIGMGEPALPLIFRELRERGGHWFWALQCITGENPAKSATKIPDARKSWLDYADNQSGRWTKPA